MTIETKYNIKQRVYISELKIWGKIKGLYIDDDNYYSYKIRFFDGKDPKECYFYDEEISLQETDSTLGFKT